MLPKQHALYRSCAAPQAKVGRLASIATLSALLNLATMPAHAESVFQPYKDTNLGFALSKPPGWQVHSEDLGIWVENGDKSELVLMQAFHPEPRETARQWLEKLGDKYSAHFPQPGLDNIQQEHTKGDEVIAALHYAGTGGPAQLRALCSIVNGKGLLYVIAAPTARFAAERSKLLHIAQSLVFTVPKATSSGGSGGEVSAAEIAATARGIHWVNWTDPREHAFHISVPAGWNVQGGTFRDNSGNVNFTYALISPKKDIGVVVGSAQALQFTPLSRMYAQSGMQEGQNGILHYMRAPEFNQMYLQKAVSTQVSDLVPGKGQEMESLSEQLTQQMNQAYGRSGQQSVSVGATDFKGVDKETGKPVGGILLSQTTKTTMQGLREPIVVWSAEPTILLSQTGDGQDMARVRTTMAVYGHAMQTFGVNQQWQAHQNAQFSAMMQQKGAEGVARVNAIGAQAKRNAAASSAAEDAIMSRYENHRAAQDNQQRGFINYIGDRTDVTDGEGHTVNVGSGYGHYYRNDRTGAVMGTNSAYSPGVDFTPMSEY